MKTKNRNYSKITMFIAFGFIFMMLSDIVRSQNQFYLSEVWYKDGGEMPIFYKNASTTDALRNVYVVGSTTNSATSNDILVQKFNRDGDLLWEQSFDGGANLQDMGTDVFVDNQLNVYVTGAATQNAQNNLDLVVLKYNSNGDLLWTYFYNFGGLPIPYDGGTAITGDNNGGIYVTGTSSGNGTMMDYITLKLSANNGAHIWSNRYDYAQLNEAPNKIRFAGGHVFVTGASQIGLTPNKWELATVFYSSNGGVFSGVRRSGGSSTEGMNEANDLTIDNQGNIYVLGATKNQNTGFDISLFKLNEDLDLVWEQHFDGYGTDDKGYGVKTDDAGNIYAVGYVSNPNQGKNYSILKYNSSGTLQWSREFNGLANLDDEAVQLVVRGDRIFVTGAARNGTNSEITTMGYTADGDIFSVKTFDSMFGLNDKPTTMGIDLDDNLIVVAQVQVPGGAYKNITFKYNVYERLREKTPIDEDAFVENDVLIVQFNPEYVNTEVIDKRNFDAGILKDFLNQNAIDNLNSVLPMEASRIITYKIFKTITTADSLSITRLGNVVKTPKIWSHLVLQFDENTDIEAIKSSLLQLNDVVYSVDNNYFVKVHCGVPNDPRYLDNSDVPVNILGGNSQSGLYDENHGIFVEQAWCENSQASHEFIKIGIFDTEVNWMHEDFGGNTFPNSKFIGGKNHFTGGGIQNQQPYLNRHGTKMAGIFGALRNNNLGIAGIAGGSVNDGDLGARLLSFVVAETGLDGAYTDVEKATAAMIEGALSTTSTNPQGYGLHVQNHSWGGPFTTQIALALDICHQNNCLIVASSGNYNPNALNYVVTAVTIRLPAHYSDATVLTVGGNTKTDMPNNPLNGSRWANSVYGKHIDVIAPATYNIFRTLDHIDMYWNAENGVSASAAHVTGVAALLLSEHHPTNHFNYPNPLSPEDVEYVLTKTANAETNDIYGGSNLSVPNVYNGYGRVHAENAMQQITLPYRVRHFESMADVSNVQVFGNPDYIDLPAELLGLSSGQDQGLTQKFKVTVTVNHTLPSNETYVDAWVRNASCDLYGDKLSALENVYFDEIELTKYNFHDVKILSSDATSATFEAFFYRVDILNQSGTVSDVLWKPFNPTNMAKFGYSVQTLDQDNTVGTDDFNENSIQVFPNPTNSELNILFVAPMVGSLEVFDLQGRKIADTQIIDETQFKLDVKNYTTGIYICRIVGSENHTFKFIKN